MIRAALNFFVLSAALMAFAGAGSALGAPKARAKRAGATASPAAAAEKDPLDELIVEDSDADPSGKTYVDEHQRLEAEIRVRRKELARSDFRLKLRIARTDSLADFDRAIGSDPSFGIAEVDPEKRLSVTRARREMREWEAQGWRPPTLREFLLTSARETEARLRPSRFRFVRFEPEISRNYTGTALESSVSEAFSEEETNEVTDIMNEVFRSHRYKERVHPGARQRRP